MTPEDLNRLWEVCQRFIREQEINCPESIYQCDGIIMNAYEFIEEVCNVVGYHQIPKEEEE